MVEMNYKMAGVDVSAGNEFVQRIKQLTQKVTKSKQLLGGIGGFAALYELPLQEYRQPVLVSSTDGVGTKLKLAIALNQHHTIGIDLVAMCANDILVCGAKPLFFLDYYATGQLELATGEAILQGIVAGCEQSEMSLIGGETAEMPGMYQAKDYDLAGFAVGLVEKERIIDGQAVTAGDALIGLASSGVHANGFSLVRKILELKHISLNEPFGDTTIGQALLTPTKIYVRSILALQEQVPIHAMAHITGGGLIENIPRTLPTGTAASVDVHALPQPALMTWLQTQGDINAHEMFRTFNCGIGMVICVAQENVAQAISILHAQGEKAWQIGKIVRAEGAPTVLMPDLP